MSISVQFWALWSCCTTLPLFIAGLFIVVVVVPDLLLFLPGLTYDPTNFVHSMSISVRFGSLRSCYTTLPVFIAGLLIDVVVVPD
jgi:hypothetical protein